MLGQLLAVIPANDGKAPIAVEFSIDTAQHHRSVLVLVEEAFGIVTRNEVALTLMSSPIIRNV